MNGLSVTYAVHQPARRRALVKVRDGSPSDDQPGLSRRPRSSSQSRNGNILRPVRRPLRTGTVGMASGYARSKRSPSPNRASIAGVAAPGSWAWSARRVSIITTRTFGPWPRDPFEASVPSPAVAAATPAPAARNWRRVGTAGGLLRMALLEVVVRQRPAGPVAHGGVELPDQLGVLARDVVELAGVLAQVVELKVRGPVVGPHRPALRADEERVRVAAEGVGAPRQLPAAQRAREVDALHPLRHRNARHRQDSGRNVVGRRV